MTEIYLIRHGETEWNAAGRFQGKLDSPLTGTGARQAKLCGERLSALGIRFDTLIASPLGRTRQTASIIASCSRFPDTQYDDRLAEVSVGPWDGLTHIDIDAQWPGRLDGSTPFDWFFRSPDGESHEAAFARVKEWLSDTRGCVVAVSHGLIGRILRGAYLGLPKSEALCLPVPQDVVWRLAKGQIEAISVR
ncbi:MAG: histidine phosphatase family protein [Sphingopyxis sp.]|nr:histidine phosphatase family protein [Sphingopyxis sp.]